MTNYKGGYPTLETGAEATMVAARAWLSAAS